MEVLCLFEDNKSALCFAITDGRKNKLDLSLGFVDCMYFCSFVYKIPP